MINSIGSVSVWLSYGFTNFDNSDTKESGDHALKCLMAAGELVRFTHWSPNND